VVLLGSTATLASVWMPNKGVADPLMNAAESAGRYLLRSVGVDEVHAMDRSCTHRLAWFRR